MYEKILVPVDGSATSLTGLQEAIALARVMGSTIRLLHVVDEISFMTSFESSMALTAEVFDTLKKTGQDVLQDAQNRVHTAGVPVEAELYESYAGRVSDLVITKAKEWGAQLIVLGTHGRRGVGRMLLGSDAEQVLRQSPVPAVVVSRIRPSACAASAWTCWPKCSVGAKGAICRCSSSTSPRPVHTGMPGMS